MHIPIQSEQQFRQLRSVCTRCEHLLQTQLGQCLMRRPRDHRWKLRTIHKRTALAVHLEVGCDGRRRHHGIRFLYECVSLPWAAMLTRTRIHAAFVAGRLHWMTAAGTPASRKDISRLVTAPVVEGASPSIERHVDLIVLDGIHCGTANQLRILLVHSLELLTHLKEIIGGPVRFGLEYVFGSD